MNITNRTTHDVQQGTGAWLRLREGYFTASEAPAALGVSRYVTRAELLRRKHTGIAEEHSPATLGKFAAGHAAEAKARPLAEDLAGGDLYPVTMTAEVDGLPLLASLDGLKIDDTICWETKLWNEELAAAVRLGADALPEHYTVQMDQELLVSGAQRCLFTCTDGTPERFVSCWYEAKPERFAALLQGWRLFAADLAAYTPPQAAEPAPVGRAPETLPALRVEVTGNVVASNLDEFKSTALTAIRSVNRELRTDADFADAEKAVKWCADVESRLAAAKQHALSQTASIDALFKTIDDISEEARRVRLDLDKLVTRRKAEVKEEAVIAARRKLEAHVAGLNAEITPMRLQPIAADFASAIKGKRSIESMQDALDSVLTAAMIEAENQARGIRANLATFKATAEGFEFLFADLCTFVHKAPDDFAALLQSRIATHKAGEERRAREKAEAEARAAEQRRQAEEAARIAAENAARSAAVAPPAAAATPVPAQPMLQDQSRGLTDALAGKPDAMQHAREAAAVIQQAQAAPPAADEPAALKLGVICERLGFTVSAAFLAETLDIRPARTDGRAALFTETQFGLICRHLISHVGAMAELYAGEPA